MLSRDLQSAREPANPPPLFSTSETDLLTPFRNGEDIIPLIHQNIKSKEKELGGQFTTATDKIETNKLENRSMITIGG